MAASSDTLNSRFGLTFSRTIIVSLVLVLTGLLIMVFGPSIVTKNSAHPAILNVGSVLLSIGLISVAYEIYLRATFTRELMSLVGLQSHLEEVGVRRVQADSDLNWATLIGGARDFRILVVEPLFWVQQQLPRVITEGRLAPVTVRLFVPDPGGQHLPSLATQCASTPDALAAQIKQSFDEVRQQWTAAATGPNALQPGSELTLWYFDEVPAAGTFIADSTAVLIVRGAVARRAGDPGVAITFERASGFSVFNWLKESTSRVEPSTPIWSNQVQ